MNISCSTKLISESTVKTSLYMMEYDTWAEVRYRVPNIDWTVILLSQ